MSRGQAEQNCGGHGESTSSAEIGTLEALKANVVLFGYMLDLILDGLGRDLFEQAAQLERRPRAPTGLTPDPRFHYLLTAGFCVEPSVPRAIPRFRICASLSTWIIQPAC